MGRATSTKLRFEHGSSVPLTVAPAQKLSANGGKFGST
ncbi:hypothetical protein I552_1724 [Mycobacterium xenopi 3993]|nr:hypothetical protein I552_1724 [Mycobacterium xenopi 3993]